MTLIRMRSGIAVNIMIRKAAHLWRLALLDRDADVHVLGPLFFSSKLEVAVGAGEVQDHQIVVLGNGGQSGFAISFRMAWRK